MRGRSLLLAVLVSLTAVSAVSAETSTRYRYTALLGPIAQPAGHHFVVGDGVKFYFSDWENPEARAPLYRVCITKRRSTTPLECWNRPRARYYYDTFKIGGLAPKGDRGFGRALVCRW